MCGPRTGRRLSDEDHILLMLPVKEGKIKTNDGEEAECVVQGWRGG